MATLSIKGQIEKALVPVYNEYFTILEFDQEHMCVYALIHLNQDMQDQGYQPMIDITIRFTTSYPFKPPMVYLNQDNFPSPYVVGRTFCPDIWTNDDGWCPSLELAQLLLTIYVALHDTKGKKKFIMA